MENRKKKLASVIILSLFFVVNIFFTLTAHGEITDDKCGGVASDSFEIIGGVCIPTNTGLSNTPVTTIINNVLKWILGIFGK